MVLTVLAPAKPVEPYANYPIGTLASDDFSSFTLTFVTNDLSSVPVQIQWKNAYGNTFNVTNNLDLMTLSGVSSTFPVPAAQVVLVRLLDKQELLHLQRERAVVLPVAEASLDLAVTEVAVSVRSILSLPVVLLHYRFVLWMKRKWLKSKLKKR